MNFPLGARPMWGWVRSVGMRAVVNKHKRSGTEPCEWLEGSLRPDENSPNTASAFAKSIPLLRRDRASPLPRVWEADARIGRKS